MTYVDNPDKKQKHPHYEHRTLKLDRKNNEFSSKKFQKIRKHTMRKKKILKSFGRIGMLLNNKTETFSVKDEIDKACLILINDYDDLGIGPLNDSYLIGLHHHQLGYKIFYLYNPKSNEFLYFLPYFMKLTKKSLTVFYSGRSTNGNQGIEFINGSVSRGILGEIIARNCTGSPRIMFITDCIGGGSVFDINYSDRENKFHQSNMISFFVRKVYSPQSKKSKRSHGICTYYFSKITNECPNITTNRLIERMNPSICRFDEVFVCEVTNLDLADQPIFSD